MGSAVVAASVGTGSNVGAGRLGAYLQNTDVSIYRRSLLWTQDPRVGTKMGLIVGSEGVGTYVGPHGAVCITPLQMWTGDCVGLYVAVVGLGVGTCEESKRWRRRTQSEVFSRGVCR